jgi:hypothetical protein
MSSLNYFPISLLTAGKTGNRSIVPGVYLRWFVKPYLGIPGISPMHPSGLPEGDIKNMGFRLFYNEEQMSIPDLNPLDLDKVLPKDPDFWIFQAWNQPGWKAFARGDRGVIKLGLNLLNVYQHNITYLRFSYQLFQNQAITLQYRVHDTQTGTDSFHDVPLHYNSLMQTIKEGQHEKVSYAIHVDTPDESITEVTFISDSSMAIGDFFYADRGDRLFYTWSAPGGGGLWQEIRSEQYLLGTLNEQPILPAASDLLVPAMTEFYDRYYGINPVYAAADTIRFVYPDLSQYQIAQPPVREYIAEQYESFCRGNIERERFYMSAQEAATLASNDPAIANLLGLFRILDWAAEWRRKRIYKVQGIWPDGKRFCIYSCFDPEINLESPVIGHTKATQERANRVLRDYATFRVHHPLNTAALQWEVIRAPSPPVNARIWLDPAAYIILRSKDKDPQVDCLQPFFIPSEDDYASDNNVCFHDWYDTYPKTDIHKVLDGEYHYHFAGLDIFGQLSDFHSVDARINPVKLEPGEIQRPEITFTDPDHKPIDIPFEIENTTDYRLKEYDEDQLRFRFSFFWPMASRYIWTKNRATELPSLDYFKLLYLVGTPLSTPVAFMIESNTINGLQVKLEQVRASGSGLNWKNSPLHELLKRLGAVTAGGSFAGLESAVVAALKGGTVFIGREFEIIDVNVAAAADTITLQLMPMRLTGQEQEAQQGFYTPGDAQERYSGAQKGPLYWNLNASYNGVRLGWQTLSFAGEEIKPTTQIRANGTLAGDSTTPGAQSPPPADLDPGIGLSTYIAPQDDKDYSFTIKLAADNPLAGYDRLMLIPLDPDTGLSPGEYRRPADNLNSDVHIPESAAILFDTDRIFCFYLVRRTPESEQGSRVIYSGKPIPFTSTADNGGKEYLLFPDRQHARWLFIPPNVLNKSIALNDFFNHSSFNSNNYLTTTLSVGVEAVVTDLDSEVKNCFQTSVAQKKVSLVRYLPPPELTIPEEPQPSFGIAGNPPDYDGNSLFAMKKIFTGYDLDALLDNSNQYLLYRLPASRLMDSLLSDGNVSHADGGMPIKYAKDPAYGGNYRRNMQDLQTALDTAKSGYQNYFDSPVVMDVFKEYSERVLEQPLDVQQFLQRPVVLPGDSRTVYIFALKAYDAVAKKESGFAALSAPIYVEDTTKPNAPLFRLVDIGRQSNTIRIGISTTRKINAIDGYGYVSGAYLENNPSLRTANLPYFVAQYSLYLTTDLEAAADPDDSDFAIVSDLNAPFGEPAASNAPLNRFSVKLSPQSLTLSENGDTVQIEADVQFSSAYDLSIMPTRIYYCLRAINYLGQTSELKFMPGSIREVF